MTVQHLWIACLGTAALAFGCGAWVFWRRLIEASRIDQRVDDLQQAQQAGIIANTPMILGMSTGNTIRPPAEDNEEDALRSLASSRIPPKWMQTGWASLLCASEDRVLMDQAGIEQPRGTISYTLTRAALAIALPLLVLSSWHPGGNRGLLYGFAAFAFGLMLPKWWLKWRASQRRKQVVDELPLFVDLLRLLQGVGLSIDQTLQVLATEFTSVLAVIGPELRRANQLYSSGRSRAHSLQRLSNLSDDDDMHAIVNLLIQIDRHGGAVQEPLREFAVRLREKRQADFKERIGHITVKMTGVMVLTLLPALIVITAGPGFLAVLRSLTRLGGGS